jgi:putative ABC transport system permease protein
MSFLENFIMALQSLKAHRMRSILTMLGIIIGVGSVIIVVAIGQGGEAMLKSEIVGSGNTIELMYSPSDEELMTNPNAYAQSAFSEQDIQVLEGISGVKQVVSYSGEYSPVQHREEQVDSSVTGINAAYIDVNELEIESGRNFSTTDFISGARVAVVSSKMQEELFDGESPIGKTIRIGLQPVEIIGVLKQSTGLLSFNMIEAYLPYNTWKTVFSKNDVTGITLQVEPEEQIKAVGDEAIRELNTLHNTEEAYQVLNMEEIAQGVGQITRIMTIIIGSIAGISLVVGGIGVMNIMLVSVTERTREIGIRIALGATKKQILVQFLIESITLTLIGGVLGILFGWGVASLVSIFAKLPALISWQVVLGGVLFSMVIGVIFGIMPANKAAKMNPIESLRYE